MSNQLQISIDAEKLVDGYEQAIIDYHAASSLHHEDDQHDATTYNLAMESREKLVGRIARLELQVKELSDFAWQVITDNEDSPCPEDAHVNLRLLSDDAKAILWSNK